MSTFTVGVGLLLDDGFNNALRQLELAAYRASKNDSGLKQPPHITVKRPCEIRGDAALTTAAAITQSIASKTPPLTVHLGKHASFGDRVLYMQVAKSMDMNNLHALLLKEYETAFGNTTSQLEADHMIYHASVAINLSPAEFAKAVAAVKEHESIMPKRAEGTKLGLFLGMNNNTEWIVIGQWELGG